MLSGIIGYIIKEQKGMRDRMEANQKEIKEKQDAQGIRLLELEYNYKDRFTKLENVFLNEGKDIRHSQDNNMQKLLGAVERVTESVEDLKEQFKEIFDANPELKKP